MCTQPRESFQLREGQPALNSHGQPRVTCQEFKARVELGLQGQSKVREYWATL